MADPRRKLHAIGDTIVCRKCDEPVVATASMVKNGRYVCGSCQGEKYAEWRLRNLEHARATQRVLSKKRSAKVSGKTAAYRRANPLKRAAHQAVQTGIRNGSLVRQLCEGCRTEKTHAHHDDYTKPLEIRWLCHRCHMAAHGRLRIAELAKVRP